MTLAPRRQFSRRSFLRTALLGGSAALFTAAATRPRPAVAETPRDYRVWVWQFSDDGDPMAVRNLLAANGLGVMVKTHEATDWMGKWDDSTYAIADEHRLRDVASLFEAGGVPFHAWCVVEGNDPLGEAQVCAQVLANGARSLTFDLEPEDGGNFWQGSGDNALAFGRELRRLVPNAQLTVAPDPRPWQLDAVPIREFASFCDQIAPQVYWHDYESDANIEMLAKHGVTLAPGSMSPEVALDMSQRFLAPLGRPIAPVGQGAATADEWTRFLQHADTLAMRDASVWRYRTANPQIWPLLNNVRSSDAVLRWLRSFSRVEANPSP